MNERIKELYKQAARYAFNQRVIDQSYAADLHLLINEKFAEVIVKECIDNIEVWELDSRNHISYMLARHFGVEE